MKLFVQACGGATRGHGDERSGAVAPGRPLGRSGARLMVSLVHEMVRRGAGLGIAAMCLGAGQGIATVAERI
jgi:acetyl-CoA acetyltransferase